MAETAIVPLLHNMDDVERAAKAMAQSGFFQDTKQLSQAIVKIMAGQELGFGAFASMTGVHIIQNKPTLAANLMAAAVKRTGKYNYKVVEINDNRCELAFYEMGQEVGRSTFSIEDAKKASLTSNPSWTKYPRNMLFARALSNGQKWYAPDIFGGATVYTPEELGAVVDGEGNVIDTVASDAQPIEPVYEQSEEQQEPVKKVERISRTDVVLLAEIVGHKLAVNPHEAKNMMLKCKWETSTLDKFLTWATVYRGWRDSGLESDEAAERTNKGERP